MDDGALSSAPPSEPASAFEDERARINLERLPLGLLVVAGVHLLHVLLFLPAVTRDGTPADRWRLAIGMAHIVMLPLALAGAFFFRRLIASPRRWRWVPPLVAGIYLAFSALMTGFDQLAAPTPIAFVIGSIGLVIFLRFGLAELIVIYVVGLGIALVGAEVWQTDLALRRSIEVNSFTVAAVAMLIARSNARLHRRIWEDRRTILGQARTDSLTGVLTRGAFLELTHATARQPGAIVLMDIDGLKTINDSSGHAAGDVAIIAVSRAARSAIRSHDVLGRLGGDEFAVLLPEADLTTAMAVAERVRDAAEATGPTVSLGVAVMILGEPADRWLARADAAMYRAKQAGRNRVAL